MPFRAFSRPRHIRKAVFLLAALLGLGSGLRAQEDNSSGGTQQNAPSLSDSTSDKLAQYKTLTDAKNWSGALALLDSTLAGVAPDSYDAAVVSQLQAQVYFQEQKWDDAIAPLEHAYDLSLSKGYFTPKIRLELMNYLGQLYVQRAYGEPHDKAQQKADYAKADGYMTAWMKQNPHPSPDDQLRYSSMLYQEALLDADKVDLALVKRAKAEVEKGLRLSIDPKENFYVLLLACLQQQEDYKDSAKLLEVLVAKDPTKKEYWNQLFSTYVTLQDNVRAILTIERAQKHGFLNTPKDNYNLVGMYFNVGQFQEAVKLLENGLNDGGIDSTPDNWKLLAYSYQQLHRDYKAIETLQRAADRFQKSGGFYYMISQIYYSMDKAADSMKSIQECVAHGGSDKPEQAWIFMAYLGFELNQLDVTQKAIDEAAAAGAPADTVRRLRENLKNALAIRAANAASAKSS